MTAGARLSTLTVIAALMIAVAAPPVCAQPDREQASADSLFADASAKEIAVRNALATDAPLPTLLKAVRTVVADYENVVRHYPASGFCDDALWRGARLARDAFEVFHEARERNTAVRLLQLLQSGYPSSRLAKEAPEQIAWLNAQATRPAAATAAGTPAGRDTATPTATAALPQARPATTAAAPRPSAGSADSGAQTSIPPARLANIKGVRRAVLKDVVRVVIELDGEVPFHDERIENPSRVFVDLPSTRANLSLIDQTLRFDADTDIVRQIRIGRHPNSTTRVVLEAAGVSSYSVYPLYSPYRLVIDCLRATPAVASVAPPSPASVEPPSPAPLLTTPLRPGLVPPVVRAHAAAMEPAAPPGETPAAPAEPLAGAGDRPAWAAALSKTTMPAVLPSRRLRWLLPLPAATVRALPAVSTAEGTTAVARALPARPLPNLAIAEPTPNVAGGLSIARQLGLGVSRIVIDPGHGGHDPGAGGAGMTEADLVLDVSLRLEKLLARLPGVEVVLTRRNNEFVTLQERTAIANREGADLFLSVHANASNVAAARGVETYFLNFASNQSAAAVAARENATTDQTMGALQDVVKAIALNSKRDESRDFATYVQRELLESLRGTNKTIKDLGVKQAPFVVLIGASMPSVLAEISFITNPQEAKLLKGSNYRQRIAQALFDGIKAYQASLKRAPSVASQQQQD
ncbi:MAG TPA: N-acetylmuramoyl-L-alanine amidase [Vicinamibacterales bacterium]|nr:N-acetylmuramoyl-L-alanine amidase [Vicinamibacterales bacterium]